MDYTGFQGSEHTGCLVTFYRQGQDQGIQVPSGPARLTGRGESSAEPSLIAVQTAKPMGQAGTFALTIKCPKGLSLFDYVLDDDWVDIVFTRGGARWHTMRGLVDEVRRSSNVGGTGTTNNLWTVSGKDFQRIFDITPLHFDVFTNQNVQGAVAMNITHSDTVSFSVRNSVDLFLRGFLSKIQTKGRSNWPLPASMPNTPATGKFIDAVNFDYSAYTNSPPRQAYSLNFLRPEGMAWELAATWSDPNFCELFTEQYPSGGPSSYNGQNSLQDGLPQTETAMTVVLRDKPFLVHDPQAGVATDLASPWFSLPLFVIPRQYIVAQDVGRGGLERYNAFFAVCPLTQENLHDQNIGPTAGNWDTQSILYHGMRRYDVQCTYQPMPIYQGLMQQRLRIRDWYAANPYFYNGSISLATGMPDLKIGTRVRIPGTSTATDETFYVEAVQHSWALPQGMRTTLAVTRGYIGRDTDLVNLIELATADYSDQLAARPGVSAPLAGAPGGTPDVA